MAGMIPNKKSLKEIEQDIENLRERHSRSVDGWLKSRLECSTGAVSENTNTDAPQVVNLG